MLSPLLVEGATGPSTNADGQRSLAALKVRFKFAYHKRKEKEKEREKEAHLE